jgi:hypothetical protein
MLKFKNLKGKTEAVSKQMIVRFSVIQDHVFNEAMDITIIHLKNNEQLRSLDKLESLVKNMNSKNSIRKKITPS